MEEIVTIRDDIERQKRDAEKIVKTHLLSMQQKNARELQQQIQTGNKFSHSK